MASLDELLLQFADLKKTILNLNLGVCECVNPCKDIFVNLSCLNSKLLTASDIATLITTEKVCCQRCQDLERALQTFQQLRIDINTKIQTDNNVTTNFLMMN
jgi:hypothetical protein